MNDFISLKEVSIDETWSFADKTVKDTSYISHGYYTYPAKFIPQLASRLINEYSKEGDIIIDPFMGSGTTVVEAIVNKRIGIGTDINELAYFISKVKTQPIPSKELVSFNWEFLPDLKTRLNGKFDIYLEKAKNNYSQKERIDYWFTEEQKNKLLILYYSLLEIKEIKIRDFYLVCFAQILKSCSIWQQKSIKPTRDFKKNLQDPFLLFNSQLNKMIKQNDEFNSLLTKEIKDDLNNYRIVQNSDARNLPCQDEQATLIVTSPPYVTSYEYADLHQLPSLWFGYFNELPEFRKKFIGSSYKSRDNEIDLQSKIADSIVSKFGKNKKANEVKNYFADMLECFYEMKRVLKKSGKICVVIGNTQFKGIDILNAEVFLEQLTNLGFINENIIHREIPSKMLPSTRDKKTGQFVKADDNNLKLAYPTEFILIMEKE